MTRLVLVRHASHAAVSWRLMGRTGGVDLSDQGRREATLVGLRLAAMPVAAVYTSPLDRAVATACCVSAPHGLNPTVAPALLEVDYGDWTGRPFVNLENDERWQRWNTERAAGRVPRGESVQDLRRRTAEFVHQVVERHADETIVAVSHAEIIRTLLLDALGWDAGEYWRLQITPASLSMLDYMHVGDSWTVRAMNDVAHLVDIPGRAAG
jgi:broad specificity phosphatase PhoE